MRSFPLLINFHGLPYIDVRVSFNSFIPADIEDELAEKLTDYYVERLIEYPNHHDKIEFEIIYSCYTLDLPERIGKLENYGFSKPDIQQLLNSLRHLTNRIINNKTGLWKEDIERVERLTQKREHILQSDLDHVSKIYWLLEDCKRYGTLPFAGLARAGFIAVQLLKSLINVGVLEQEEYNLFMETLDTVSSRMTKDLASLTPVDFLKHYGHLRPGTYDILSPRYDEEPERYFDWLNIDKQPPKEKNFVLSLKQLHRIQHLLEKHGLEHDILGLFDFIKKAIEGREYAKFIFSNSLSDALALFKELAMEHGFSAEECSYTDISCIYEIYGSSKNVKEILQKSISEGKEKYSLTKQIVLPPVIIESKDVWAFQLPQFEPNFITLNCARGQVVTVEQREQLKGGILFIPSADPGYDWIFSHKIAGFVTMYGGVNSHMAIRANELGVPAIIGAGERLYKQWSQANLLEIDCLNKQVRILR